MGIIELREEDLVEQFIHSSGKGGQNVNKVATCVYLKHLPSGIEVKCQKHRTQAKNREEARKILTEKLIFLQKEKEKQAIYLFEKNKRRNRKKTYSQKQNTLQEKRKQSLKKELRKKINLSNTD